MSNQFIGICLCGHYADDHHGDMVMNPKALEDKNQSFRNVDGILFGGCEYSWVNGERINEQDPECKCQTYWDKGWKKMP